VGFRFRRSVRLFPGLRINLSKSGASLSLGGRGFHYTVAPKGTRVTAGIPGTGLSWTEYSPHTNRSPISGSERSNSISHLAPLLPSTPAGFSEPPLVPIQSAAAEKISALSTSELAPILNSAHRRSRLSPLILFACLLLLIPAFASENQLLLGLVALLTTVFVPLSLYLDRYRRSVKIEYKLEGLANTVAAALAESFGELRNCNSIWSIRAEGRTADWKRHAGATGLVKRHKTHPRSQRPACIRGRAAFPCIAFGADEIYFLPDAALLMTPSSIAALRYQDFTTAVHVTRFIEDEAVPRDANVVGETWRYVNKNGGPDRRFNFNKRLPVCLYGEMDFQSAGGLSGRLQFSNSTAADRFSQVIETLHRSALSPSESKSIMSFQRAKRLPSAIVYGLFFLFWAVLALPVFSPMLLNLSHSSQGVTISENDSVSAPRHVRPAPPTSERQGSELREQNKTVSIPLVITPPMYPAPAPSASRVPSISPAMLPLPRPRP
jgi:hypothetical protein